jgi:molybdopterin converting factor small subunit
MNGTVYVRRLDTKKSRIFDYRHGKPENELEHEHINAHLRKFNQIMVEEFRKASEKQQKLLNEAVEKRLKDFKKELNDGKSVFEKNLENLNLETQDLESRFEDIKLIHSHNVSIRSKPVPVSEKLNKHLCKAREQLREAHKHSEVSKYLSVDCHGTART